LCSIQSSMIQSCTVPLCSIWNMFYSFPQIPPLKHYPPDSILSHSLPSTSTATTSQTPLTASPPLPSLNVLPKFQFLVPFFPFPLPSLFPSLLFPFLLYFSSKVTLPIAMVLNVILS
jgi:hypothetical protein